MAVKLPHHIQNIQCTVQIVGIILDRLFTAFAHRFICGKLNDSINIGTFLKNPLNLAAFCHIRLIEPEVLTGDFPDPLQGGGTGVIIVVCYHNVIACVQKLYAGMAADISGTAGNQNCHCSLLI